MAKPAITKRITKGSALTYSELDTNFQNIIDSILTVTDGTSDINLELIDTLELRGDHNIKVTATPSGNIVTIDNEIPTYTKEPSGFPNLTETTISFNNGSRKFTITPTGASFRVWVAGEEFVKTAFEEITITNTTGLYSIYYDSTGQLGAKTTYVTYSTETPVAQVYWNATLGVGRLAEQRHGIAMDWATHEYLHRTRGAAYASGLSISNYTILGDGSLDSHAQFDLSSGVFFDEDLRFNITHSNTPTANFEQDLQGPARIPVAYHSGATGEWTFDTATDYAVKVGTTIATYNLNTAGTWTTPDITSTHYVAMWIVATNFISEPIVAIMGQRTDNKLEDAENNNTWAGLDLTNFPSEEFRPLYRIIFRSATTYTNAVKSYIAEVTDYRQTALGAGSGVALQANSFGTVSVSGQSDVIADQVNDALTLVAGTGITLTTDATTDSVTITNASPGGNTFSTIAVGATNVVADSTSDTLTLLASGSVTLTANAGADSITISSSASGVVNSGASGALAFYPSPGGAVVDDTLITYSASVGLQTLNATNALTVTSGGNLILQPTGSVTITPSNNSNISLNTSGTGVVTIGGAKILNAAEIQNGGSGVIIDTGTVGITGPSNTDIYITPVGTGRLIVANDVRVGQTAAGATIESNWNNASSFLKLRCRNNVNSGTITIEDQGVYITAGTTSGRVYIQPQGSANETIFGDGVNATKITSSGATNLTLNTATGTNSGSIVITAGANNNITITPNGTGKTVVGNIVSTETLFDNGNTGTATITPNAANGATQKYTVTGSFTWNAFGTPLAGQSMTMILVIGGAGGYTMTSSMKFAGASKTISTTVGAIDIITVYYDGTTYYASLSKGFA